MNKEEILFNTSILFEDYADNVESKLLCLRLINIQSIIFKNIKFDKQQNFFAQSVSKNWKSIYLKEPNDTLESLMDSLETSNTPFFDITDSVSVGIIYSFLQAYLYKYYLLSNEYFNFCRLETYIENYNGRFQKFKLKYVDSVENDFIKNELQTIKKLKKEFSKISYTNSVLHNNKETIQSQLQKNVFLSLDKKKQFLDDKIYKERYGFDKYYIQSHSFSIIDIVKRKNDDGTLNDGYFLPTLKIWRETWHKEIENNNLFDIEVKKRLKMYISEIIHLTEKIVRFLNKIHKFFKNKNQFTYSESGSSMTILALDNSEIQRYFSSVEYQKSFIVSLKEKRDYETAIVIKEYSIERIERILRHFKSWYAIDFYETPFKNNFERLISEIKEAIDIETVKTLSSFKNADNQFNKSNENITTNKQQTKLKEYTFKEIFVIKDYEKYINALHKVEKPVIDKDWNFIGTLKGSKGVVCNWIKYLQTKGIINAKYNRQILAKVCNNEIKDFNLGKDGKTFDNTSDVYDENYKELLLEIIA